MSSYTATRSRNRVYRQQDRRAVHHAQSAGRWFWIWLLTGIAPAMILTLALVLDVGFIGWGTAMLGISLAALANGIALPVMLWRVINALPR